MNVYDALAVLHDHLDAGGDNLLREAKSVCGALVDAWETLTPDWESAPAWARWFAVDATGVTHWFEAKPHCYQEGVWLVSGDYKTASAGRLIIGLFPGIDWRECVWARPSAQGEGG